ncbi:MAG: tRNA pseudouridine(38-40) synthase TruA [Acidimicrobiaceae bacterium]|nr:tRNA pseudouridine(38-40) synthase TruA [Acidimicrobiaceae bacterium]
MTEFKESSEIRVSGQEGQDADLLRSEVIVIGAIVSYIGAGFSGFAFQEGLSTVAGELLRAIDICLGVKPRLSVAGRTDAGVHARAQVISFQMAAGNKFSPRRFVKSMNSLLDPRISIRAAWIADDEFDARFSARYRQYRYRFALGATPDPFTSFTTWLVREKLDSERMQEAARCLVGEHNFASFCRKDPNGASLMRRVDEVAIESSSDTLDLWITASSFCHQMVRSVAGLLYQVGTLKRSPEFVAAALIAEDRGAVKLLAPAQGLVLWQVGYDDGVLPEWSSV